MTISCPLKFDIPSGTEGWMEPDPWQILREKLVHCLRKFPQNSPRATGAWRRQNQCTGGWIAKCCTDMAGSSVWFDRAYIAYSYGAKEQMLGVSHADLLKYGAVSEEIACQMATVQRNIRM